MPKMIWIDLETTGLDPNRTRILEAALFESTTEDPFNTRELYHAVLSYPLREEGAGDMPDEFVIKMHAKTGLWAACAASTLMLSDFEYALTKAIGPVSTDYKDMPVLAGSTPQFDRGYLRRWCPRVDKLFHHRHFDASSVKLFARMLGMPKIEPKEAHRAEADVLESIDHARQCFNWCKSAGVAVGIPPAGSPLRGGTP